MVLLHPAACRQYIAMLDKYKSAVIKEREARKKVDTVMKQAGHVSMLAEIMSQDYDEHFPDLGDAERVAHLSFRMEEMQAQLKEVENASTADAAATALRVEKEGKASVWQIPLAT